MNDNTNDLTTKTGMIKIITDEPTSDDLLDFRNYAEQLAHLIFNSKSRFSIAVFGEWGTGKTSLMKMIREKLDSYNVARKRQRTNLMQIVKYPLKSESDDTNDAKILTVWFDAWKYEKEKYLAVIPLIRTIRVELDNSFGAKRMGTLRNGLNRTFAAFTEATELNLGLDKIGSIQTNLSKFLDVLQADGKVRMDTETVYYHPHVTDHLSAALKKMRLNNDFRIVVFIDDLDRCIPEKALEVLESIKSFFDMEGIVFVIGMDSNTLNEIISAKYGGQKGVTGQDYIEKIVQLPFHIPQWTEDDISGFIESIIHRDLKKTVYEDEVNRIKLLLVNSIERNPRQVKRFINTIILAQSVFNKDVDKLLVVQALNFRDDWKRFLEFITSDDRRIYFLKEYMKLKEPDVSYKMEEFVKVMEAKYPTFSDVFGNSRTIFKNEDALTKFLDVGAAEILSAIKVMEEYRRALDTTTLQKTVTRMDDRFQEESEETSPIWFTHKVPNFSADSIPLKFKKEGYQELEWSDCTISVAQIQNEEKLRIFIRSSKIVHSNHRQRPLKIRYMFAFDIKKDRQLEIIEDLYDERIDRVTKGNTDERWVIKLDQDHYIWQWKEGTTNRDETQIFKVLTDLKSSQSNSSIEPSNIFDAIGKDSDGDEIIPVIYLPAIHRWKNYIREVHCQRIDNNTIEATLVFSLRYLSEHKYLNKIYSLGKSVGAGRRAYTRSFLIKLENGVPKKFQFPGVYSAQNGMENDEAHGDATRNGSTPSREIRYYYGNSKHPIVFVNTANSAMAEFDANSSLWKWEYIPWEENTPVIFGKKSRSEIENDF